jgi:hypothetical protein
MVDLLAFAPLHCYGVWYAIAVLFLFLVSELLLSSLSSSAFFLSFLSDPFYFTVMTDLLFALNTLAM